jgi:hypothetical protein
MGYGISIWQGGLVRRAVCLAVHPVGVCDDPDRPEPVEWVARFGAV